MALTVTFPNSICFANNDIIISAYSSLNKTFTKIVTMVTGVYTRNDGTEITQTFEFSLPSPEPNSIVYFNIKSAAETVMTYVDDNISISENTVITRRNVVLKVWLYEEYIENGSVIPSIPPTYDDMPIGSKDSKSFLLLPGGLTDYELFSLVGRSDPISVFFDNEQAKFLSRKPDGEVVPIGEIGFFPFAKTSGGHTKFGFTNQMMEEYVFIDSYTPAVAQLKYTILGYDKAAIYIPDIPYAYSNSFFAEAMNKETYYSFIFKNGFGVMETVFCYPLESILFQMDTTDYSRVTDRANLDIRRRTTHKSKPFGSISMSSGFVNEAWADWFVNEFIASEEHYLKVNDNFVPVNVVPGQELTIRNRNNTGLLSINFNVEFAFDGSVRTTYK